MEWKTDYANGFPLSIYYPNRDTFKDKAPVIIFNTGWNQARGSYLEYGRQLAEWGFVVAIRFFPNPDVLGIGLDINQEEAHVALVSALIDWLGEQNENSASPLFELLDMEKVGEAGHSLGTNSNMAAAIADDRIRAIVNLDGWFDHPGGDFVTHLPHKNVAIMWINADQGLCTARGLPDLIDLYDYVPSPAADVMIHGASHIDFMILPALQMESASIVCGRGQRDQAEVRTLALKYMICWFNVQLKGMTEFEDYYKGAKAKSDENEFDVSFRWK